MFNLLVSSDPTAWENSETCRIDARRFGEYSDERVKQASARDPDALRTFEGIPTLLAYEAGVGSPNASVVRYGQITRLRREGPDLVFDFTQDKTQGYLPRSVLSQFSQELAIHRFEHHRTHWAVKEGKLPPELLAMGEAKLPQQSVSSAYESFRKAMHRGIFVPSDLSNDKSDYAQRLASFPPSEEKAFEYLRIAMEQKVYLPAHQLLGLKPKSSAARAAVDALHESTAIITDPYPIAGQGSLPFSAAAFYANYGAVTETARLDDAIEECAAIISDLESSYRSELKGLRSLAYVLWQSGRHHVLTKHLRRQLRGLIDRIMLNRMASCIWRGESKNADLLASAMVTVGMQRLGDDKHRAALRETIQSLCSQRLPSGALPTEADGTQGDVLTTVLFIEAVQRSGYAEELAYVIESGEAWIMEEQQPVGAWRSDGWSDTSVTANVLDYFEHRSTMLPQIDGFFLMARDFLRKSMELQVEGGANNARLAAIAAVHALEMFLYGLFDACPDLGVSAYRAKGDETLGPREALRALQDGLRQSGDLGDRQSLSYRDQISGLIRERDNIIHHASEISEEELSRGLEAAAKFISKYGADLIGLDILQ